MNLDKNPITFSHSNKSNLYHHQPLGQIGRTVFFCLNESLLATDALNGLPAGLLDSTFDTTNLEPRLITTIQEPGLITTNQEHRLITTNQEPGLITTKPKPRLITTNQKPRLITANQEPGLITTNQELGLITTNQKPRRGKRLRASFLEVLGNGSYAVNNEISLRASCLMEQG